MLHTQITHESIAKLMDIFYTKVRYHENLGPIFNAKITESDECWEAHKEHIGRFGDKCCWVRWCLMGSHSKSTLSCHHSHEIFLMIG